MKLPDKIFGEKVDGAYEKYLARAKEKPKQEDSVSGTSAPSLDGSIYVPSIKLYFAKERSLHGKNWNETQKELQKQGLKMPTIREFVEFLKYLRKGYSDRAEADKILDEILTVRSPYRAEWLDAKFSKQVGGKHPYMTYHKFENGKLKEVTGPLEDCLMEDLTPGIDLDRWLDGPTKQGLPQKICKKGSLYYWYPIANYVAWFRANSDRACLNCCRLPQYSGSGLGVFACAKSTQKIRK